MAKVNTWGVFFAICLLVILAGCTDGPTPQQVPSGCGDDFCGVGETSTNCPIDCGTEGGTTPSSYRPTGRYDAPELELVIDDTGVPDKLQPGDQALIIVRIKNKARQSMSEIENQRLTIRNVKVLLYDFGDFIGCTPSTFDFSTLGPDEEREISCTITAPTKEVLQRVRIRTFYTYDLYVSLDNIHVFSQEEYNRERPTTGIEEVTISGPLSMIISASKIPVQSNRPVNIAVELESERARSGGILEKDDFGVKYHIELVQVQVPEEFLVTYSGPFTQTGNTLTTSKVRLLSGDRKLSFSLTAPDLITPRETFSLSAVATGFDVFMDDEIDLEVVTPE
jgi:hypothetical protein